MQSLALSHTCSQTHPHTHKSSYGKTLCKDLELTWGNSKSQKPLLNRVRVMEVLTYRRSKIEHVTTNTIDNGWGSWLMCFCFALIPCIHPCVAVFVRMRVSSQGKVQQKIMCAALRCFYKSRRKEKKGCNLWKILNTEASVKDIMDENDSLKKRLTTRKKWKPSVPVIISIFLTHWN